MLRPCIVKVSVLGYFPMCTNRVQYTFRNSDIKVKYKMLTLKTF